MSSPGSNSGRDPQRYDVPTEQRRSYIAPGQPQRYMPAHTAQGAQPPAQQSADDYRHHPLHHIYRKRIRGIRMRWLSSGFLLGLLLGVLLTLIGSALVVTRLPIGQRFSGNSDVQVTIGEAYLNREAAIRLKDSYQTGVANLSVKSANIDLKADNRMDLQPTFNADLGMFGKLDIVTSVKNELTVKDGKLVIGMVGDPQLGDLNVPLEFLPFDLKGSTKTAIDKINNELLISEINQAVQSGFGANSFDVQGVTTSEDSMTIRMQHK